MPLPRGILSRGRYATLEGGSGSAGRLASPGSPPQVWASPLPTRGAAEARRAAPALEVDDATEAPAEQRTSSPRVLAQSSAEGEATERSCVEGWMDFANTAVLPLIAGCAAEPDVKGDEYVWEVAFPGGWVMLEPDTCQTISDAQLSGVTFVEHSYASRTYVLDLESLEQRDVATGERQAVRCSRRWLRRSLLATLAKSWQEVQETFGAAPSDTAQGGAGGAACLTWALLALLAGLAALGVLGAIAAAWQTAAAVPAPAEVLRPGAAPAPSPAAQPAPRPEHRVPQAEWPALRPSQPGAWHACLGAGSCAPGAALRSWRLSPREVALRVRDLSEAAGVAPEPWRAVTAHWRAAPPLFAGRAVRLEELAAFTRELLVSDPFATGDEVPFVDFRPPNEGKVVALSQRQLAFLVANALLGNSVAGGDGLSAALQRCGKLPEKRAYVYALLSLLAVLSRELGPGEQGASLLVATPRAQDASWKSRLGQPLQEPTLCRRSEDNSFDCGLQDFMSGGTPNQAVTDIAGGVVGGGAQLCDLADSQDESLVQFWGEVMALAFFTSAADRDDPASGMLPSPVVVLGARRYLNELSGESLGGNCGAIHGSDWLNQDIPRETASVAVAGKPFSVHKSAFVAVASVCSQCRAQGQCSLQDAVNNQCDQQRRHLDEDVAAWYQAFEVTMYNPVVQDAFRALIHRVGSGPWGAGVWFGDSQQYFLAAWLATSLLSGNTRLDYYVYDSFCENQANQCFVLGSAGCEACVGRGAFPGSAVSASSCGRRGIQDMVAQFSGRAAGDLHQSLVQVHGPPQQVFDALFGK